MYAFLLMGAFLSPAVTAALELRTFRLAIESGYTATTLNNAQQVASVLDCARMCWTEYSNCFSITYHTSTGACTPRSWITKDVLNTIRPGQELFYYTRVCNEAMGFQLYTSGSVAQCLYISTDVINFTSAREICEAKGSKMFMVKSKEKLDLLRLMVRTVTKSQTWVGLTDMATEGKFVWADGEPTANVSFPTPWSAGQPDDNGYEEDCVEMGKGSMDFINDLQCYEASRFICETELSAQ